MKLEGSSHETFIASGLRGLVAIEYLAGAKALGLTDPDRFDRAIESSTRVEGGRSENHLLSSASWPGRVRLRPLRHGGLLGVWAKDRYLTPRRCEREFRIWKRLEARGAPIPPAALAASRRRGVFWRSMLGVSNRERTPDALAWLLEQTHSTPSMSSVAVEIAHSVRRFHDAGALHGDLHLGNLLLEETTDTTSCWLIDLGRTRLRNAPSPGERMRDLMRLRRSIEKSDQHACLDPRIQARFLSAYCQGDRGLRRALLRSVPKELRRLRRHRLGWQFRRTRLTLFVAACVIACSACSEEPAESKRAGADAPRLSLLATGDTGRNRILPSVLEGQFAVARAMVEEDREQPVDGLILLGDNFYWHGLERAHLAERILGNLVIPYCHFLTLDGPRSSEVQSGCTTPMVERNPIPLYAVLGNHDLELPESAHLQREVVPEFLPGWQMSDSLAEVIELPHGVSLILFESEISIDDPKAIDEALVGAIQRAQGPWRIIATHRPIATDDLGGEPIGGYPIWVRDAIAHANRPVQLVLAGHHHNLQAFALRQPSALLQIGVGSGSRAAPPLAGDPPGSLFGAIQLGFARIDLIGMGEAERLEVSLYGTAPWPIVSRFQRHSRLASFEVDRMGSVSIVDAIPNP